VITQLQVLVATIETRFDIKCPSLHPNFIIAWQEIPLRRYLLDTDLPIIFSFPDQVLVLLAWRDASKEPGKQAFYKLEDLLLQLSWLAWHYRLKVLRS